MVERKDVLVVEKIVKEYGDAVKTRALGGVDLRVGSGELLALVGPSGSGKSTLLNIIGLLDRPTTGRVVLGGTDTSTLEENGLTEVRARMLGFVFQFHHLLPAFTALENVMLPAWGDTGWPSEEIKTASEAILRDVGLSDRMHYRATNLSGGQQQRVAIARALSRKPPLVLADEPTGNLDTVSSGEIFALMRKFNRELGTTFIVVTHDPRIADQCDRIVTLVDGLLESDRPTRPAP